jgi:hypothetical protein
MACELVCGDIEMGRLLAPEYSQNDGTVAGLLEYRNSEKPTPAFYKGGAISDARDGKGRILLGF